MGRSARWTEGWLSLGPTDISFHIVTLSQTVYNGRFHIRTRISIRFLAWKMEALRRSEESGPRVTHIQAADLWVALGSPEPGPVAGPRASLPGPTGTQA